MYFQNTEDEQSSATELAIRDEIEPYNFYNIPSPEERKQMEEEKKSREDSRKNNIEILKKLYCPINNEGKHNLINELLNQLEENLTQIGVPSVPYNDKYTFTSHQLNAVEVMDYYIKELSVIIGIYLKIEWGKVKNGE